VPTGGELLVNGVSTTGQKLGQLSQNVGYCYQNPDHQIFSSSVEKEVRFGPANLGVRGEQLHTAVDDALELVGLTSQREEHPFALGRGQRQLLAVASVLAMGAPVLIIDEPTTGMDHAGATAIMELLARWNEQGRTIVIITHDMDVVAEFVPRSVVMAGGEVVADGPTLDVLRDGAVLEHARLETPPAVWMSSQLSDAGISVCGSVRELAAQVIEALEVKHAGRI
jgi:energy-coupling factor transporter ATP-binding protein EcfA2